MGEIEAINQTAKALGLPVRAAYTTRQAARILGVGKDSLYNTIHSGRVRAVRVGRMLYISTAEMARILAGEVELEPPAGARRGV
jgi:excisionase family DNA binding protein